LKNRVSYFVALMAVLTGAASTGHAFTLGDLRGSAVIGRSLDVSVPVLPGAGEEAQVSCLSADVLYADAQQVRPSLTVTQTTAGPVPVAMVRIRSASAVSEPVVTVVLRSTCGSPISRQYVLLSDFPAPDLPRAETPPVAEPLPPVSVGRSEAPPQGAASDNGLAPVAVAAAVPELRRVQSVATPARPVAPKPAAPVKKRPKPPAEPVKVVPLPPQAKPVLKLDQSLVLPVQGETPVPMAQPASAAASAPSEEVVQQALRIEALQNDIKVLKEMALKNQANLADFQAKLRQAEDERVPLTWFYLLASLLAASLATLTWLLLKQQAVKKNDDAWWQQVKDETSETVAISPPSTLQPPVLPTDLDTPRARVAPVMPVATATALAKTPAVFDTQPIADADLDLDIDLDSLAPADEPPSDSRPLALLPVDEAATAHNINVENVSDIRQQAEFFVSLGQTDRALNVLRKQIMESPEPNPLVYLDLLTLYHTQGLKSDFRELRAAFNRFFNGVVPDFPAFSQESQDLLDYPEPLAVLVRFWPNIEAIAFLEACIFRNEAAPMQMSFDLPAFRDLLMLHAVAEKVTSDSPWKMTHFAGLSGQSTASAELAGLAMVMDMRGKAAAKAEEAAAAEEQAQEDSFKPLSVAGPPSQGLDLEFPADDAPSSAPEPKTTPADKRGDSPYPDSL